MSIQYSAYSAAASTAVRLRYVAKASFVSNFPAPAGSRFAQGPEIPVLYAHFETLGIVLDHRLPSHMGWGSVELEDSTAMTFRVQVGDRQFLIYANAADPAVWEALDQWNAAGKMRLCLCTAPGQAAFLERDFSQRNYKPGLREQVQWDVQSRRPFLANASLHVAERMTRVAWSDLPEVPVLGSVHGAIVCTQNSSTAEVNAAPVPANRIVGRQYGEPIHRPGVAAEGGRGGKTQAQKKARDKAKAQAKARAQARARERGRKR